MHIVRRNVDVKILLFNNRIYGLTKGQYSPTSEQGKKTKSTPMGAPDHPIRPISIAIAAEASFAARSVDVDVKHLEYVLERAAKHVGTAFVEIYQNCNIFNDGAFTYATDKTTKTDTTLYLEHGKPLVFGKEAGKGIRLHGLNPEIVDTKTVKADDLLIHDEKAADPSLAFLLSRMRYPDFPEPLGVFRDVEQERYVDLVHKQNKQATERFGVGDLQRLVTGEETWSEAPRLDMIYNAMMLGLRDYVRKNRFRGVVLGMSGGIDSALSAAVAVDALGPERVRGVRLPSRFTSA
jgi:2-oxoglutarate ferredoxin oxidoreductase subunit beta